MGKGFKHGGGSAPSDVLNFKIVGGQTQPSDPKENTIWVNTHYDVKTWDVSPTEPSRAVNANGDVWLKTDPYGAMAFNALKKNCIQVQLGSAYVYSNGWVECDAAVYQNGKWNSLVIPWDGYYFKDGNQYNAVTGGWTTDGWSNDGSVTVGSTIVLSSATGKAARVGTAKMIDLTNVNKIWCDSPNGMNGAYNGGYLCIKNTKDIPGSPFRSAIINTAGAVSLDVSSVSGEYYIYVYAYGSGASYLDIRAIWAE